MKKIIYLLIVSLTITIGCTGVKTLSTGKENEAFLNFVGNPANYANSVTVVVDDKTPFKATVNKEHSDRPKGNVYSISSGTHTISVFYNDNIIYKQQIFISSQETKNIILP